MKKIACFIAALVSVACSNDMCDWSGGNPGDEAQGTLSVTIEHESVKTRSLTDYLDVLAEEKMIRKIEVFVFDKTTGKLNAYKQVGSVGQECVFSVPVGNKSVYAVVNGPDFSSVTTYAQFKLTSDDLMKTNIQDDGFVMIGHEECSVTSGTVVEPVIVVRRMVARVVVQKIVNSVAPQYGDVSIECVYLGNANTVQTMVGMSGNIANVYGYADMEKSSPIGKNGVVGACPEYFYRNVGSVISNGSSNTTKYHMYCHPSSSVSTTCVYVLATIDGEKYYYRVPLYDGLQSNKTYSVEMEIVNLGSNLPPDGDFQKGEIKAVVNVADWEAGESYSVEF